VLLGKFAERRPKSLAVGGPTRHDHRLEGRRCKVVPGGMAWRADGVADLNLAVAPELADPAGGDRGCRTRRTIVENENGRHLRIAAANLQPVADADASSEHPDIGDPFARRAAFDLENVGRDGCVDI